ncbi:hypothetical protein RF663_09395 [Aeromonas veronii]|uniref:hypothetical protein n=1 Tax=Aeromonas veronii TaxID=654 RepID=UPI0028534240|nr:hypothetical protein [Aeromonas veronii]MDR5014439.1 hypothetical protein [Aeromonas veronii]
MLNIASATSLLDTKMINMKVSGHVNSQMNSSAELQSKIRHLECNIITIKNKKNETASSVSAINGMIKQLNRISTKHGDNSIVRLKASGKLKHEKSSSKLKNLFNLDAKRLKSERRAAVELVRTQSTDAKATTVMAKECSEYFTKLVNDGRNELTRLSSELPRLDDELHIVKEQLTSAKAQEHKIDEAKNNIKERIQVFSVIYRSDHGYPLINAAARSKYGNSSSYCNEILKHKNVLESYTQINDKAFKNEQYKHLPWKIKNACKDMDKLVEDSAELFYNKDGGKMTTYRGQSMTTDGLNTLRTNFDNNKNIIYGPGQFFSTTKDKQTAYGFANANANVYVQAPNPVRYTIKGFSSVNMLIPSGLGYDKDESERIYSPLARFKVVGFSMVKDESGQEYTNIDLHEVRRTSEKVEPLPA